MSILNVVGAKVWGGGEQYVYDMCDELHRRQISSFVLVDKSGTTRPICIGSRGCNR